MRFSIEKKELIRHIQHLSTIIPSKNTTPILTNYLIEADSESNSLKITASDLEITVVSSFSALVMESGVVAISARHFNEIVISLPDLMIEVFNEDEILKIKANKIDFSLLCADHTLFPIIPEINLMNALTFPADVFHRMITKTSFAVSSDPNRAVLCGGFWKLTQTDQLMAATDGRKVAEMVVKHAEPIVLNEKNNENTEDNIFNSQNSESIEKIIPIKTMSFLQKIYDPDFKDIKIVLFNNRLNFLYAEHTIFSNLIDHKYPDYRKAFLYDLPNTVIIDKEALKQAIRRVALQAPEDNNRVRLEIDSERFEINTTNRETGDAKQIMEDYTYQGNPTSVSINFKFILAILDAIDSEKVKICLGSQKDALMIYNETQIPNQEITYLLMPLRS